MQELFWIKKKERETLLENVSGQRYPFARIYPDNETYMAEFSGHSNLFQNSSGQRNLCKCFSGK
jgi:hypothetical protein